MAAQPFDGRYDYTKPWTSNRPADSIGNPPIPKWSYSGPWSSNMERLTSQALMAATMPRDQLQETVRPPLPQIQLFPDRFGFGIRSQPSIDDIVEVDRMYQNPRVQWFSGSPGGYSGSSRNSQESN